MPEQEFSDTERLDWVVKNHYSFREIYFWFAAMKEPPMRLVREKIDEEIRKGKAREGLTTDGHR